MIEVPNMGASLNQTPIFEQYVVLYGSTIADHKDIPLEEIALHAQNLITILNSVINIIRGI